MAQLDSGLMKDTQAITVGVAPQRNPATSRAVCDLVFWLVLAVAAWLLSYEFDGPLEGYEPGAAAWPRAIILLMSAVAVLQFCSTVRKVRAGQFEMVGGRLGNGGNGRRSASNWLHLAAVFLVPMVYVFMLPNAGHFAASPIFLILYMIVLGETRFNIMILSFIIVISIVFCMFSLLLYVPLPTGSWPGFYEFGQWATKMLR